MCHPDLAGGIPFFCFIRDNISYHPEPRWGEGSDPQCVILSVAKNLIRVIFNHFEPYYFPLYIAVAIYRGILTG